MDAGQPEMRTASLVKSSGKCFRESAHGSRVPEAAKVVYLILAAKLGTGFGGMKGSWRAAEAWH